MRIILAFLLGLLINFFLAEGLAKIWRKSNKVQWLIKKQWDLHHSKLGVVISLLAFACLKFNFFNLSPSWNTLFSTFWLAGGIGMILHHLMTESFMFSEALEHEIVHKHRPKIERLLEITPGAATWIALTMPLWLSYTFPFAVAYLILLADVYWLVGAVRISALTYVGYNRMRKAESTDWIKKLDKDFPDQWKEYYHLLVIPTSNETLEILQPAFDSIANMEYPKDKVILGVGFEERYQQRDPEKIARNIAAAEKYENKLYAVFTSVHPMDLPGEVRGPGTNRNWMVQNAVKEFKKRGIPLEKVIITTLDADFVVHKQFIAGALHKYLSTPAEERDMCSFTGCFIYNNNYWAAPTPMRVIATGTAFWQLSEMVGSDKYINFSSLSMNFKSLVEIGGWIPDKVNDDSGFFWKAYYHFKGKYKVIPHFMPISADAVLDESLWKTFKNQYLQLKRWAYGVEHVPFIITKYFETKDMSFWDKTDKLTFILWSYFKWGTLALFITFGGMIIPLINPEFSQSVVSRNLTVVSSYILTLAFIGLFTTIYVNEKVAPPRPKEWGKVQRVWSFIQWLLVPFVIISITTIPAIDAQTTLMLGKRISFRTTVKARQMNS